MFVINSNPHIDDLGRINFNLTANGSSINGSLGYDGTFKTFIGKESDGNVIFYVVKPEENGKAYRIVLQKNAHSGIESITFSGFGIMSNPVLYLGQFKSGNYFVVSGTSTGSVVKDRIYNITISGTTITLGSTITTAPTISGKTLIGVFGHESNKIYAVYSDNTTKNLDTMRKWNGSSWSTMTLNAVPSNVGDARTERVVKTSSGVGVDFSRQYFWVFCELSNGACVFDAETETWKVMNGFDTENTLDKYMIDQDGCLVNKTNVFNTNGFVFEYSLNRGNSSTIYYMQSFFRYGFVTTYTYGSNWVKTSKAFVGDGYRVRTITSSESNSGAFISTNGGKSWFGVPATSNEPKLNITGDLVVCLTLFGNKDNGNYANAQIV